MADLVITLSRYLPNIRTPAVPAVKAQPRRVVGGKTVPAVPGRAGRPEVITPGAIEHYVFPVNGETLDIRHGREAIDISLLNLGNRTRLGPTSPSEVSFSSFIPEPGRHRGQSWLNVPDHLLEDPWQVVKKIRLWQEQDDDDWSASRPAPLRLAIANTYDFSPWVVLTQFDVQARPGEPGDVYFTATFREVQDLPVLGVRVDPKPQPSQVVTRKGDTLHTVIKRQYGSVTTAMVTAVYNLNKKKIGSNRNRTFPAGFVILLPKGLKAPTK